MKIIISNHLSLFLVIWNGEKVEVKLKNINCEGGKKESDKTAVEMARDN